MAALMILISDKFLRKKFYLLQSDNELENIIKF